MSDEDSTSIVLFVIAGFVFLVYFKDTPWANAVWYSFEYNVGFGDVTTGARPHDCDFLAAPLGDKGCGYKAYVQVFNGDGALVAGDNAPTYSRDVNTQKIIMSYDGGKSWDWYIGENTPNLRPKSVRISWVRENKD
jgi:hypothetical protein